MCFLPEENCNSSQKPLFYKAGLLMFTICFLAIAARSKKNRAKRPIFRCLGSGGAPQALPWFGTPVLGHVRLSDMCMISREKDNITRVAPNLMFLLPEAMSQNSLWKTSGTQNSRFTCWCWAPSPYDSFLGKRNTMPAEIITVTNKK